MIEVGGTFAVGRMRKFPMDPDGHGRMVQTIGPNDPKVEYVVLLLGRVPKGSRFTQEDVVAAIQGVLGRELAAMEIES